MWELKREDINAFLVGMTTYGTGGGGNPETGRALLEAGFAAGRVFRIADPSEVPDNAFVCSGGIMGSVRRLREENDDADYDAEDSAQMLVRAIHTMEKLKDRKVDFLIPFEVGGSNTPVIMAAAAIMGLPTIDADGVGRAAPETQMTSWIGKGISLTPMPVVAQDGNSVVVMDGNEPTYADEIGRVVVVKGGGSAANAHYAMSGREMKTCSCLNILSRALELGKLQTEVTNSPNQRLAKARAFLEAETLFRGILRREQGVDAGGFYLTELEVNGSGAWKGRFAKLTLKNETMALWVDNQLCCLFPDYIYMLNPATGESVQTADIREGMDIEFACAPCHPALTDALRTEVGRAAFAPARYGHPELEYVPFAQLHN